MTGRRADAYRRALDLLDDDAERRLVARWLATLTDRDTPGSAAS